MSAMEKMLGKKPQADNGGKAPSMMESAMLKMLEGVGLDGAALQKMQADVAGFANSVTASLVRIEQGNAAILENQAKILADLALLTDKENGGEKPLAE